MIWPIKKLSEACDFKLIKNTKSLPYIGMEDIESDTGRFLGLKEVRRVKSVTSYFDSTCVLYGKLRPYLNKVFVPDFEGHCSTEFLPLRPNQEVLSREWLSLYLKSANVVSKINLQTSGARMPRANISFLKELEIPVPPIEEQRKIVARLEKQFAKIDEVARLRAESVAATTQLLPAALHEILSQAESSGWEVQTLGSVLTIQNGFAFKSSEYVDSGYFVMRITNVQDGHIVLNDPKYIDSSRANEFARFILQEGDMLMSLTGNVGRIGEIRSEHLPALLNQRVARITVSERKRVNARFVFYFLQSDSFIGQCVGGAHGVAQLNVSTKKIGEIQIPLPSLAEQEKIVKKLDALSEKVRVLQELQSAQAADLKALKQSILHQAFSGGVE